MGLPLSRISTIRIDCLGATKNLGYERTFKKVTFFFFARSEKMCFGGPALECPFLCVDNYHMQKIKIEWKYSFAAYFSHPYAM